MSKEQRAAVDAQLRAATLDLSLPIDRLRSGYEALMATRPYPGGVREEAVALAGRPALRFEPEAGAAPGAVLLYFHGGSWVVGSPAASRTLTAALVQRAGIAAYSLEYRLAPEHPFPAAIEDAVAAYRELLGRGFSPERIAFAGDSAGGGLTVDSILAARDASLPLPGAAVTFSGGFDQTRSGESMTTKAAKDPLLSRESLVPLSRLYVGEQDRRQPLLSPVFADLAGLPPLLLQVGSNEILLDDSVRLAARAAADEVDVTLDVTAGVPHVFQLYMGELEEADAALDRAARFLTERLQRQSSGTRKSTGPERGYSPA